MDQRKFGRYLYKARKLKHLTSNELASEIGMSGSYIRQLECGKRKPSLDLLIRICNRLEVPSDYLLQDELQKDASPELKNLEGWLRMVPENKLQVIEEIVRMVID